jgi:hypothetical protein
MLVTVHDHVVLVEHLGDEVMNRWLCTVVISINAHHVLFRVHYNAGEHILDLASRAAPSRVSRHILTLLLSGLSPASVKQHLLRNFICLLFCIDHEDCQPLQCPSSRVKAQGPLGCSQPCCQPCSRTSYGSSPRYQERAVQRADSAIPRAADGQVSLSVEPSARHPQRCD